MLDEVFVLKLAFFGLKMSKRQHKIHENATKRHVNRAALFFVVSVFFGRERIYVHVYIYTNNIYIYIYRCMYMCVDISVHKQIIHAACSQPKTSKPAWCLKRFGNILETLQTSVGRALPDSSVSKYENAWKTSKKQNKNCTKCEGVDIWRGKHVEHHVMF